MSTIFGNYSVYITTYYRVAGEDCQVSFPYPAIAPGVSNPPSDIADYWLSDVIPSFAAAMTDACNIYKFTVAPTHPPGLPFYSPVTYLLDVDGIINGDTLPPQATVSIKKVPSSTEFDPDPYAPAMKPGEFRMSGIPESWQVNGTLVDPGTTFYNNLGEAVEGFTIGANDYRMVIARPPREGYPDGVLVYVAETAVNPIIGSQNTRKRK